MSSIAQYFVDGLTELEDFETEWVRNPSDFAGLVEGIGRITDRILTRSVVDLLGECDTQLREYSFRPHYYTIDRKVPRTLITSRGEITFNRTRYTQKEDGKAICLLDRILGLPKDDRLSEDAKESILKSVVKESYKDSGRVYEETDCKVSKQAVKDLVHSLAFPEYEKPETKKKIRFLYIDADEDHISQQFVERKGDLPVDSQGRKTNTIIGKMVYVYEGIEADSDDPGEGRCSRHRLINPHYFMGLYEGSEGNNRLWDEVYEYIDSTYDLEYISRIYLNSDGGSWIHAGAWRFGDKLVKALDGFHLSKYLNRMTSQMLDSQPEANRNLRNSIRSGNEEGFRGLMETLKGYCEDEAGKRRVQESGEYILNNWGGAMVRLHSRMIETNESVGSSTEAHVFHTLSRRMSTIPMGWSRHGADRMCRLRAYSLNGGDMLRLVRYTQEREYDASKANQKKEAAIPAEFTVSQALHFGEHSKDRDRYYLDRWNGTISVHDKKRIWFGAGLKFL